MSHERRTAGLCCGPLAIADDVQIQSAIEAIFKVEFMPRAIAIAGVSQIRAIVAVSREVIAIKRMDAAACGGMHVVQRPDYRKPGRDRAQKTG